MTKKTEAIQTFLVRTVLVQTVLPAALIVGIAYNALVTVNGEEGRKAAHLLREEVAEQTARLDEARARTAALSDHADRLLTASLDQDLLEERLRARLGLVAQDEYMVRMGDVDRLAGLETLDDPVQYAALRAGGSGR
ncbi:FtsB family cell division protein [Parvularcula dongshanensis]|uniref:Cell division protein FtsB n=1 Tax=Parvularcula dongshanensis TaxID=1173995 RepID=A0A840I3C6_9PROT|nr:septum formation initiator family protein [Parvularcula dongshanensis]MBB4659506.1 cell division protein FtsB [Parvularcula dongshanensis]